MHHSIANQCIASIFFFRGSTLFCRKPSTLYTYVYAAILFTSKDKTFKYIKIMKIKRHKVWNVSRRTFIAAPYRKFIGVKMRTSKMNWLQKCSSVKVAMTFTLNWIFRVLKNVRGLCRLFGEQLYRRRMCKCRQKKEHHEFDCFKLELTSPSLLLLLFSAHVVWLLEVRAFNVQRPE